MDGQRQRAEYTDSFASPPLTVMYIICLFLFLSFLFSSRFFLSLLFLSLFIYF